MNTQLLNKQNIYKIEKKITPSYKLMNNAGKLSAKYINQNFKKKNILILCGTGGNGGDGYVLAEELYKTFKWNVIISIIGNLNKIKGDTKKAFKNLSLKSTNFENIKLEKIDYVVDAFFGIGLSRNIKNKNLQILKKINSTKIPIIALDIPSGVESDTGKILGFALDCTLTLTFSFYKIGQFLLPGAKKCGKIILLDIGIPKSKVKNITPNIRINSKSIWSNKIMWPSEDDNKYSRGYTLIIGGPKEMTGASRLAAHAAQRTGSGIVVLACNKSSADIYYKTLTSQIVKKYSSNNELNKIISDKRIDSIIIGPGLGANQSSKRKVINLLKLNKNIIIDADAISCFKNDLLTFKKIIKNKNVIITPHEGELKNIFPNLKGSLLEKAIFASKTLNTIVVLKSSTTVIASPNKNIIINKFGSKWLSTAGSGDVLAGILGALTSNKMEPFYAAAFGVWLHSAAEKEFGPGLIAEDIPDIIPIIFKKLLNE